MSFYEDIDILKAEAQSGFLEHGRVGGVICLQGSDMARQVLRSSSYNLGRYRSWIVPTNNTESWRSITSQLWQRVYFLDSTRLYEKFQVSEGVFFLLAFLTINFLSGKWNSKGKCSWHRGRR